MKVLYSAESLATGGCNGCARTVDGQLRVDLALPVEMGGDGNGNNPEQLFACGYAACFLGVLKFVAEKSGTILPDDAEVSATVGIGPRDDGAGFGLAIRLVTSLPGLSPAVANGLIQQAHIVCPYSDLSRGNANVEVDLRV